MFNWLRNNWKKVVSLTVSVVVVLFGSIKEAVEYVQTFFNFQFPNLSSFQVILVTVGIIVLFLTIYDALKPKERWFNWRDGVRCRKCGHLFDFQHRPNKVRLSEKLDSVTVACPYCEHEAVYQRKEWVKNLYDRL